VRSRRECLDIVKLSVWEDKRCDGTLCARYYQAALMWCSGEHDDARCLVWGVGLSATYKGGFEQ
jgi:hypothetical protein